jgi:hypothetical protein
MTNEIIIEEISRGNNSIATIKNQTKKEDSRLRIKRATSRGIRLIYFLMSLYLTAILGYSVGKPLVIDTEQKFATLVFAIMLISVFIFISLIINVFADYDKNENKTKKSE